MEAFMIKEPLEPFKPRRLSYKGWKLPASRTDERSFLLLVVATSTLHEERNKRSRLGLVSSGHLRGVDEDSHSSSNEPTLRSEPLLPARS